MGPVALRRGSAGSILVLDFSLYNFSPQRAVILYKTLYFLDRVPLID